MFTLFPNVVLKISAAALVQTNSTVLGEASSGDDNTTAYIIAGMAALLAVGAVGGYKAFQYFQSGIPHLDYQNG